MRIHLRTSQALTFLAGAVAVLAALPALGVRMIPAHGAPSVAAPNAGGGRPPVGEKNAPRGLGGFPPLRSPPRRSGHLQDDEPAPGADGESPGPLGPGALLGRLPGLPDEGTARHARLLRQPQPLLHQLAR